MSRKDDDIAWSSFFGGGGSAARGKAAKAAKAPKGGQKPGTKIKTPPGMTPNMKGFGGKAGMWKNIGRDRSGRTIWKKTKRDT